MASPYLKNLSRVTPGMNNVEEQRKQKDAVFSLTTPDVYQASQNYAKNAMTEMLLNHDNGEVLSAAENETFATIISNYWGLDKNLVKSDLPGFIEKYTGIKVGANWLQELGEYASTWEDNKRLSYYQFVMNMLDPESDAYKKYEQKSNDIVLAMSKKQKTFNNYGKIGTSIIEAAPTAMQLIDQLILTAGTAGMGAVAGGAMGAGALVNNGMLVSGGVGATLAGSTGAATTAGALTGAAVGQQLNLFHMDVVEAGGKAYEMRQMYKEDGTPMFTNEQIKIASTVYAAGIHLIEGYTDKLVDPIVKGMGLGKLSEPLKKFFEQNFITRLVGYGWDTLGQSVQEGIEGLWSSIVTDTSKDLVELLNREKVNVNADRVKEVWKNAANSAWEDFSQSLVGFGVGGIPTAILSGMTGLNRIYFNPTQVNSQMSSDAKKYFTGGRPVDIRGIDTMGDTWSKESEESIADHQHHAIPVAYNEQTSLLVPVNASDRALVATLRESGATGVGVIFVDAKVNESVAQYHAAVIDDENDYVYGTSGNTILVKDEQGLKYVDEYFRSNSNTTAITQSEDGTTTYYVKSGNRSEGIKVKIGTQEMEEKPESVEPVKTYKDWASLQSERMSDNDPYSVDNYLRTEDERRAYEAINKALPESEKMSFNQRRELQFSKLGAARIMPIVSEITGMNTSDVLDKFVFTFDTTGKLKEANAYGGFEKVDGKLNVKIRIDKAVRPDTIMHEVIHGLRSLATSEQLAGFAEAYGGAVGGMWVEDIKKTDNGWVLGDKTYKTHDEALEAASKYEERFVDDFMRYLYGEIGFNDAQKSFFAKVKQFFEVFWDRMRSILADKLDAKTVKAFDILFGKDTPAQERADFVEVAATEGIKVATELASTALEDETMSDKFYKEEVELERQKNAGEITEEEYNTKLEDLNNRKYEAMSSGPYFTLFQKMAPNGKPSNLTDEQWEMVRTPEFKAWFGDWENDPEHASKIVDENGEPLVVYHGTMEDFDVFDASKTRANMDIQGNFFSPWELDAKGYGTNVRAFFLNIKNPADSSTGYKALSNYKGQNNAGIKAREQLVADGYDGVNNDGEEYIAFDSNQIKSATNNNGQFSTTDNSILHQRIMDRNTQARIDADYESVENALRADTSNFDSEGNHLAPNGEKSSLTYKQWVQVRTPAFMDWFGDWLNDPENASKVLDGNGEPRVVHHGTKETFDVFNKSDTKMMVPNPNYDKEGAEVLIAEREAILNKEGFLPKNPESKKRLDEIFNLLDTDQYRYYNLVPSGFFFAGAEETSLSYGDILMDCFLNIRNPKILDGDGGNWNHVAYWGNDYFLSTREFIDQFVDSYTEIDGKLVKDTDRFDGIIFRNITDYGSTVQEYKPDDIFVALYPNQIKSATDNTGEFNADNNSILYQAAGDIQSQQFKDWFGESKIVDSNGNPLVLYHGTNTLFDDFSHGVISNTGNLDRNKRGFFFTNSYRVAGSYMNNSPSSRIMEVYLKMENPLEYDYFSKTKKTWNELFDEAKSNGNDGIIVRNVVDSRNGGSSEEEIRDYYGNGDDFIVFNPDQIRTRVPREKLSSRYDHRNVGILYQRATDTEEFKNWFKDSKVVDEKGSPLRVYHGTPELGFTTFKESRDGLYYFTDSADTASEFAKEYTQGSSAFRNRLTGNEGGIYPVYLSMQNPLDFRSLTEEQIQKIADVASERFSIPRDRELANIRKMIEAGNHQGLKVDASSILENLSEYGYDGIIADMGIGGTEYAVVNPNQIKSVYNTGTFDIENDSILYQKADYDGSVKITSDVREKFEKDKNAIPETSNWHGVLFQLESVSANVKTSYKDTSYVAYEVSMQPEVQEKFNSKEWKESDFEIASFEQARFINTNEERQKDWQSLYAEAMAAQWTKHKKDGSVEHVPISFGMMKKDADGGKVQSIPCVDLSTGCQRIRTVIERIENGILPADTPIESCYGGTCFVNLDQAHKLYGTENVDTKDLVMVTPDNIKKWFKQKATRTFLQRPNGFIRMGFRGDCAHSFPILDGWNTSLAETWLQCIKDYDIRNPKTGEYMKTIFITAGYAPTTVESYARLVPFKDMCEIHVSTSGWFSKNELMLRLAEYDVMNRLGLNVSLRVVTDKNQLSDSPFNNTNWLKHMIFDVLKVPQSQLLGTAYHNDKTGKHSEFDQDFENQCCVTGKCASCKVGCMSLVEKIEKGYKREDAPFGTQFVTDEDYLHKNGSKTGLILLQSIDTSPTTEIQPQDSNNYLTVDRTKQEEGMLYQLSDEERAEALKAREADIREATLAGKWIRTEYVAEFAGQEWADNELYVRNWMAESPEKWDEFKNRARDAKTYEDLKKALAKEKDKDGDSEWGVENWDADDERLYKRLYQIAQLSTPQEKNSSFIANHVMGDRELVKMAKTLREYSDLGWIEDPNRGDYANVLANANRMDGVSDKVLKLNDDSTSAEIAEAREAVFKDTSAYRNAFNRATNRDNELEALDENLEGELENYSEEQFTLGRRANAQETDWKKTAEDLEKKLADAEADLAKLNKANLTLEQAKEKLAKAREELKALKAENKGLKERQSALSDIAWRKITEKNQEIAELKKIINAFRRKEEALAAREERKKIFKNIKKTLKVGKSTFGWNSNACDVRYLDAFSFLRGLFAGKDRSELIERRHQLISAIDELKTQNAAQDLIDNLEDELEDVRAEINGSEMKEVPAVLRPFTNALHLKADNRISKYTTEELSDILTIAKALKEQAKRVFAERYQALQSERSKNVSDYFEEIFGQDISDMDRAEIREAIASMQNKEFRFKIFKGLEMFRNWNSSTARLTRKLDGGKEGVLYNFFTRVARELYEEEQRNIQSRLEAGERKFSELGLKTSDLNKILVIHKDNGKGYTFKKDNGQKVRLTVDQAIGVYIYGKNEDGLMKLRSAAGNGITEDAYYEIIAHLTSEQKAWGDWMMQELESHWQRLSDIMYSVYNSSIGRVENYFTFKSDKKLDGKDEGMDIVTGSSGDTVRYVNKGFTKERVRAIYPLDLHVSRTWGNQVRKEEHFVAFAKWGRDANYYMDTDAGFGEVIEKKFGANNKSVLANYVEDMISPRSYTDEFDKVLSTVIGRGASAMVAGNLSVMAKQLPTLASAIGNIGVKEFFSSVIARNVNLENFLKANQIMYENYEGARKFINDNSPVMKGRKYGSELIDNTAGIGRGNLDNATAKLNSKLMRATAGLTDSWVTSTLWLGMYMTTFNKLKAEATKNGTSFNIEEAHKEAVFKAGQLISETQNTSVPMDLSFMMRKAKAQPALKPLYLFSSTTMNMFNQLANDFPLYFKNRDIKGMAKVVLFVALNMAGMIAINGAIRKKRDEDDEEYAKRLKNEILSQFVNIAIPGFGSTFSSAIKGWSGNNSDISFVNDISSAIGKFANSSKNKTRWENFVDIMSALGYATAEGVGLPANASKKLIQSVVNGNPGYLINKTWGEIVEDLK